MSFNLLQRRCRRGFVVPFGLGLLCLFGDGGAWTIPILLFYLLLLLRSRLCIEMYIVALFLVLVAMIGFSQGFEPLHLKIAFTCFMIYACGFSKIAGRFNDSFVSTFESSIFWKTIILISICSIPIVDNFGFFNIPRIAPFGIDPNNFIYSMLLFSRFIPPVFAVQLILLSQSFGAAIFWFSRFFLIGKSFEFFWILFISFMLCLLGVFNFQDIWAWLSDLARGFSWFGERIDSLFYRIQRSAAVFDVPYRYEGLNPHISVFAGFLKIGYFSFFYSCLILVMALFVCRMLFLSIIFSSVFVDIFYGPPSVFLPLAFAIASSRRRIFKQPKRALIGD